MMTPEHVQQIVGPYRILFDVMKARLASFTWDAVSPEWYEQIIEAALAAARAGGAVDALRELRSALDGGTLKERHYAQWLIDRRIAEAEAKQTETHARLQQAVSKGEAS